MSKRTTYELWFCEPLSDVVDKDAVSVYILKHYGIELEKSERPFRLIAGLNRKAAELHLQKLSELTSNPRTARIIASDERFYVSVLRTKSGFKKKDVRAAIEKITGKKAPSDLSLYTIGKQLSYMQAQKLLKDVETNGAAAMVFSHVNWFYPLAAVACAVLVVVCGYHIINVARENAERKRTEVFARKMRAIGEEASRKAHEEFLSLLDKGQKATSLVEQANIVLALGEMGADARTAVNFIRPFLDNYTQMRYGFRGAGEAGFAAFSIKTVRQVAVAALGRIGGEDAAAALRYELDKYSGKPVSSEESLNDIGDLSRALLRSREKAYIQELCRFRSNNPQLYEGGTDPSSRRELEELFKKNCG